MIFKKCYFIYFYCLLYVVRSESEVLKHSVDLISKITITPQKNVEDFCKSYQGNDDFLNKMSHEILFYEKLRIQIVNDLKYNKVPGCRKALSDRMNKYIKNKTSDLYKNTHTWLTLAIVANIPEAKEVIEQEIRNGSLSDWIDLLQKSDHLAYLSALKRWVYTVASKIRDTDKAQLLDEGQYGKMPEEKWEQKTSGFVRIWSPILMNRYLAEVIKNKLQLSKGEISQLNIIYATSTAPYRSIFQDEMIQIITMNTANWISCFRKEPVLIQFRLLPLMEKAGGETIKRELVWLSQYHKDLKIRSLAQGAWEGLQ